MLLWHLSIICLDIKFSCPTPRSTTVWSTGPIHKNIKVIKGQPWYSLEMLKASLIAKFMGPTWGPPGSCRPQMGPMLAPWTLLSGMPQRLQWISRLSPRQTLGFSDATWSLFASKIISTHPQLTQENEVWDSTGSSRSDPCAAFAISVPWHYMCM